MFLSLFGSKIEQVQFEESLYELDRLEAEEVKAKDCVECCGPLDRSDYWRRPRGGESAERRDKRRLSFCCRACRRRTTPGSVRFLGRKVYSAYVVVMLSAVIQGREKMAMKHLVAVCGTSAVTIRRWKKWWQESVKECRFWDEHRGRLSPALNEDRLITELLQRFRQIAQTFSDGLCRLLRFLNPLSIPSQYPS